MRREKRGADEIAGRLWEKNELAKLTAQRERIRACTREAGDKKLKGFDRVEFIASCIDAAGPV